MESGQGLAVRVLFAGACRGNFNKLLKRVEKVHNKNGPFDALFCAGNFFSETDGDMEELNRFLDSDQQMPMKTYFLGAYSDVCQSIVERLSNKDCNIHCLGKSGVLEMPSGLCIAFVGGSYDAEHFEEEPSTCLTYTRKDVASLKTAVQSRRGDVDFFLTSEWPENIIRHLPEEMINEAGELPKGSAHISGLLSVIRPRYHFTSAPPLFFSRPPYKNPDLGAGCHVTRFTSLCPFGNMSKQNLFALCLTPARFMTPEKLSEIPVDTTEFPFDRKRLADTQVERDVVVSDSSCTPPGNMSSLHLEQDMWSQQPTQAMLFQGDLLASRSPSHAPLSGNGQMGGAVQRLLKNIGRGGAMTSFAQNSLGTLQTQSSFGSGSFDLGGGALSPHINGSVMTCPPLDALSPMGDYPDSQMHFNSPYPDLLPNNPVAADLQNIWTNLSQNSQLLNAALSIGLIPSPVTPLSVPQEALNPMMLIPDALSNLASLHQNMPDAEDHITPGKMESFTANMSASNDSGGQNLKPTHLDKSGSDSKRYKRPYFEGNIVRDRRKTCFVGNLPCQATRNSVTDFFAQAGDVVHVVKRLGDGNDATWAFVQYASQQERNHAVQTLNHSRFEEQEINVSAAKMELDFDPNEPVTECWFCLGSPASDKALVVSVGTESYVAIDKGPIHDEHALVVPISHYPNTLRMPNSCYGEMRMYLKGLQQMFASQGRYLLAFERYLQIPRLNGNHTHISVISIDESAARRAKETFVQRGQMQEGEWTVIGQEASQDRDVLHDLVGDEEYIVVFLPDGCSLVRPMFKKSRLPISFCRDVMAELAGIPERADWKVCISSESEERMKVEKFRSTFNPFDYSTKT